MTVYNKILICIDGSQESLHAFEEAIKFAQDKKLDVFVLSVAPPYSGDLGLIGIGLSLQELNKAYQQALDVAKNIAERYKIYVQPLYEEGEPYEKIVDISEELSVDLIVMGKKGLSAVEQILIGSVTERVIGYSKVDVLVVPKFSSIKWNSIVVATDGSKDSKIACERALQVAKQYSCQKVSIVSIPEVASEVFAIKPEIFDTHLNKIKQHLTYWEEKFSKESIQTKIFIQEGKPYKQILEIASNTQSDIIITGSHGRTGLRRLLMGSTCQRVIGLSKIPTLVIK
ncbi:MAG TPA: universal stress protein [Thermodesulfovibrio thiophilus]|uniref:universal stress protein n=1 Tax=Thermodesulfovibrio thiophilus TaxID=340095 RepID=UPI0017FDE455|nr:universal stress protein [Thermodesulfovibrio thiophilus]HHW20097.1 universal stress protein [Thermodesulfovibrio thiophilus]HQD35982.1 universal stress protein [Thermodesulfovibrio thiophilus]